MPSKKRLTHLANRTVKVTGPKYTKRFNKFWNALENRQDRQISHDHAAYKLYDFAARDDAPRGHIEETPAKQAVRKRVRK